MKKKRLDLFFPGTLFILKEKGYLMKKLFRTGKNEQKGEQK